MQQAVRVEGIDDAAALAECETDVGATRADRLAIALELLAREAVFGDEVRGGILALGRHAGVQFERLEVQVDVDSVADAFERAFERGEADRAPRTDDVGNEIDADRWPGH